MLIVNLNTLHTVNALHFVHDVILNSCRTHDVEDVVWCDCAIRQCRTGTNIVVFLNKNLLRQWHEVFANFTKLRGDDDFAITTLEASVGNFAVDFANNGRVRRVASFEQLGNTRQTTGDVTSATACRTRNLNKHIARKDFVALLEQQVCTHWQGVRLDYFAVSIDDLNFRNHCAVLRFDDNLFAVAGSFFVIFLECYAFHEVHIVNLTGVFRNNYGVEWVPFANQVALLHCRTRSYEQLRTVNDVTTCEHHLSVRLDDAHFCHTADYYIFVLLIFNCAEFIDFDDTVVVRLHI